MRQENLTTVKGGLNRLRTKGAALKDSLFELLNGYVTTERTVKVRPGTLLTDTLTTGTKGLVHFDGGFHVFASTVISVPSGYTLHLLKSPDDAAFTVAKIHFAEPFLGALYVAAEFSDGSIYHFWLQGATTWQANNPYKLNETVEPISPNGFVYKARRLAQANPAWTANTPRSAADIVEPTTENGFKYTVSQVIGPTPRSGAVEPLWPTKVGAVIVEDLDDTSVPATPPAPTPDVEDDVFIDDGRIDRYVTDHRGDGSRPPPRDADDIIPEIP